MTEINYKSTQTFLAGEAQVQRLLERIKSRSGDALIKVGTHITEIRWGNRSFMFYNHKKKKNDPWKQGLWLFMRVRKEAKEYLIAHPNIKLPKEEPPYKLSKEFRDPNADITATDINHAYWRIAFNLGIISKDTYERALPSKFKTVRLAALSTMGQGRTYEKIIDGEPSGEMVTKNADQELKKVYLLIRFTCYQYMNTLKTRLGDDFIKYATDCIYYRNTKNNVTLVQEYFTKKKLTFKQLES